MTRYTSLKSFKHAQKSFTYISEALTALLSLGTVSWIVTCDSHQQISQFPTLVAAHQPEVRGPPVGRGPQVENRCSRVHHDYGRMHSRVHGDCRPTRVW